MRDVGKSALSLRTITISSSAVFWRTLENRQSDDLVVVSIFSVGGMNVPAESWMSSACQFSSLLESERFSTTNLAASFRAIFHSVIESLIISTMFFFNSADSDVIVNGRRILRMWRNVGSAWLDPILRSSMSRKIRTLHALSLRPLDRESELDTSFRNELTMSLYDRLSCGKNDFHMKSHRQTEIMCWTSLSLRKSAISVCQIDVESKIGSNLVNFWWTASGFYVRIVKLGVDQIIDDQVIDLSLRPVPKVYENISTTELWWHQIFAEIYPRWKLISSFLFRLYETR